jgi:hypothetical protein
MPVNETVPPVIDEAVAGETLMEVTGGVVDPATVITAEADFVGSATLVAVTVILAEVAGAV